jgi:Lar family restriction alleviation protein
MSGFLKSYKSKLLPCPFCGGERVDGMFTRDGWSVGCLDCGASVRAYHPDAHTRAASKWNTRVHDIHGEEVKS